VSPRDDISPRAAFELLERAIGYALGAVRAMDPDALAAPTPCTDWDLGALLHHVNDSLELLHRCIDAELAGPAGSVSPAAGPAAVFRARATRLIGACGSHRPTRQAVVVGGYPLAIGTVAATGALEVAVHGWDISWATHETRPIPSELAGDLLWLCPLLVVDAGRYGLFAPPVALPPTASVSDRLVAVLGRDPRDTSAAPPTR
jgi:uncharacterized protein (TIGR03086 family)